MAKIKEYFKKLKEKINAKILSKTDFLNNCKKFFLNIFGYGILINYTFWALLHVRFFWYTFPAYGCLFYLIKEEFVAIVKSVRSRRLE